MHSEALWLRRPFQTHRDKLAYSKSPNDAQTMAWAVALGCCALFTLSAIPNALGRALPDPGRKLVARKDWEGAAYTWLYQFPLPIPPVKTPSM